MTTQVQDSLLASIAEDIADRFVYLQVDTSTLLPSKSAVELTNGGTQIGSTALVFNKLEDSNTLTTKVVDNKVLKQYTLASGEPFSQPVNLGSFGMMTQEEAGGGLGIATGLPVTFTKTNQLAAKVRAEVNVIRLDEV